MTPNKLLVVDGCVPMLRNSRRILIVVGFGVFVAAAASWTNTIAAPTPPYYYNPATEIQSDAVTCSTTPYGPPANLQATLQSAVPTLAQTWSQALGVTGYNIYRGTYAGGEADIAIGTTGAGMTTWTDTSVTAGQTYYYVVTSVGCDGSESDDSNEASATACRTPQNLTATQASDEVDLDWSPSLGAASYNITRTPAWYNGPVSTQDTSYADKQVQDSVTYTYQVQAVVSYTERTSLSNPASATLAGQVTYLTAVQAQTGIYLHWAAPTGAESFNIYRGLAPGQEGPDCIGSSADVNYTDTTATKAISQPFTGSRQAVLLLRLRCSADRTTNCETAAADNPSPPL